MDSALELITSQPMPDGLTELSRLLKLDPTSQENWRVYVEVWLRIGTPTDRLLALSAARRALGRSPVFVQLELSDLVATNKVAKAVSLLGKRSSSVASSWLHVQLSMLLGANPVEIRAEHSDPGSCLAAAMQMALRGESTQPVRLELIAASLRDVFFGERAGKFLAAVGDLRLAMEIADEIGSCHPLYFQQRFMRASLAFLAGDAPRAEELLASLFEVCPYHYSGSMLGREVRQKLGTRGHTLADMRRMMDTVLDKSWPKPNLF